MTKDYSKEVTDLQKECSSSQGKLFRLLERVLNERTVLDMKRDKLARQVRSCQAQLNGKELEIEVLKTRLSEMENDLAINNAKKPISVYISDDVSDHAKLKRTINSLQKKLDEETVEIRIIVEKIQDRAETHGIEAANSMYDAICLLLDDVAGWKKNKAGLDKYFREYRKRKSNIVKIQGDVDQMILDNQGTVNHN